MTDINDFKTIAALNTAYLWGMLAKLGEHPPEPPPFFDELHKAEWRRGYNEQE